MMGKNFESALEYLNSLYNFEKDARRQSAPDFHLESIRELLTDLAEPHRRYPVVHIAGTKGKGSVAAMLTAVFRSAGLRVGTYTSPHLVDIRERIAIDGAPVDEETFAEGVFAVREVIGPRPKEFATFFEVLTASAFWIFARRGVDVAVVEAGLGGRFDATNVVVPEIAVLTRIGLDHTDRLGGTVDKIARDKAHIIKPGCTAVVAPQLPEALEPILERIDSVGARGLVHGRDFEYRMVSASLEGIEISLEMDNYRLELRSPLVGSFFGENVAASAVAALAMGIPAEAVARGIESAWVPGRMQIISRNPLVIVDGAHNPPAAEATSKALESLGLAPAVMVMGINRPKDYRKMLSAWAQVARVFVFARLGNPREYSPRLLADFARQLGIEALTADGPAEALKTARRIANPEETIFVAGSLYLAGEILRIFAR